MLLCDVIGSLVSSRDSPGKLLGLPSNVIQDILESPSLRVTFEHAAECYQVLQGMDMGSRYILDKEVIVAATEVLCSRPHSLRDCLSVLRIPWSNAWVEWVEADRYNERLDRHMIDDNDKPRPKRVGFLVSADETGRRGTVQFFWNHPDAEMLPAISPLLLNFDFDQMGNTALKIPESIRAQSKLYKRWAHSDLEMSAIEEIDRTMGLEPSPQGMAFALNFADGNERVAAAVLENAHNDMSGEALSFISIMMIMTARNAVTSTPEERGKLNKARSKKGESLLLDHVHVRLRLNAEERLLLKSAGRGAGGERRGPRMHIVGGHPVRRQDKIYWRRTHFRGVGNGPAAVTRTVRVSL